MNTRRPQLGFSLIELMIALVIVAVLASIAVPNYRQYILKSHRAEAKAALLAVAAAQERFYLQNNSYTTNLTGGAGDVPPGLGIVDYDTSTTPDVETENLWYKIEVTTPNANAFSVTATPIGKQTDDKKCTSFTLTSAGTKSSTGTAGDACWD